MKLVFFTFGIDRHGRLFKINYTKNKNEIIDRTCFLKIWNILDWSNDLTNIILFFLFQAIEYSLSRWHPPVTRFRPCCGARVEKSVSKVFCYFIIRPQYEKELIFPQICLQMVFKILLLNELPYIFSNHTIVIYIDNCYFEWNNN